MLVSYLGVLRNKKQTRKQIRNKEVAETISNEVTAAENCRKEYPNILP